MSWKYKQTTHEVTDESINGLEEFNGSEWELVTVLKIIRNSNQPIHKCIMLWKSKSIL